MPNFIEETQISTSQYVDFTSRYKNSKIYYYCKENSEKFIVFETYKKNPIVYSNQDKFTVIKPSYEYRPDLLSFKFYGFPHNWWRILEYNGMKDILEFKSGITVRLPPG